MAAFPLAKYKFPGAKIISNVIILSLLFTPQVTFLPRYIVMANLKIIDTYFAPILPWIGHTLGIFLLKQFMTQIPTSLLESAAMDARRCR